MDAWDDEDIDPSELVDTIVSGVFHHPAQRDGGSRASRRGRKIIFESIEDWWNDMGHDQRNEYREKLSRDGVENGENHKEGVYDTGHSCGHPLKMKKFQGNAAPETFEDKIAGHIAGSIMSGVTGGFANIMKDNTGVDIPTYENPNVNTEQGGGLGGLVSKFGEAFGLGGGDSHREAEREHRSRGYDEDRREEEYGRRSHRYEQSQYQEDPYRSGGGYSEERQYQEDPYRSGGGYSDERQYRREERYVSEEGYGHEERREYSERHHHSHHHHRHHHHHHGGDDDDGFGYGGRDDDGYGGHHHHGRDDDNGFGYGGGDEYGERRHHGYSRRDYDDQGRSGWGY